MDKKTIGIVMGVYPFINMVNTVNNTTGDVAVSLIVAKSEGLVDMDRWDESRSDHITMS